MPKIAICLSILLSLTIGCAGETKGPKDPKVHKQTTEKSPTKVALPEKVMIRVHKPYMAKTDTTDLLEQEYGYRLVRIPHGAKPGSINLKPQKFDYNSIIDAKFQGELCFSKKHRYKRHLDILKVQRTSCVYGWNVLLYNGTGHCPPKATDL